jgi:hypothetical protein
MSWRFPENYQQRMSRSPTVIRKWRSDPLPEGFSFVKRGEEYLISSPPDHSPTGNYGREMVWGRNVLFFGA